MLPETPPTLVILAAGQARRYGRLKQLEPVGAHGETLLDYNIFDALHCGFHRCVLVVPAGLEERFLAHVREQFGSMLDVACVTQPASDMPEGRAKPWGTAHAVLAVAEHVDASFAVINGDDAYGRSAFASVASHLLRGSGDGCLAAYRLARTLSAHGGVSRGICELDGDSYLTGIVEATEVRREGDTIVGHAPDGSALTLADDAPTSMNLWGFPPTVMEQLRERWQAFRIDHGASKQAEFLLSTAVHDLVRAGTLRLCALRTDAEWFGLTFPADTADAHGRVARCVENGQYPEHLSHGLG